VKIAPGGEHGNCPVCTVPYTQYRTAVLTAKDDIHHHGTIVLSQDITNDHKITTTETSLP
jgi:hypothetical protein